uniref:(northern house mosquito) hypothetical protein n=1 Tax=Culex pipiens TaxID=7175 RepID=A0A8D8JIX4_CULPI
MPKESWEGKCVHERGRARNTLSCTTTTTHQAQGKRTTPNRHAGTRVRRSPCSEAAVYGTTNDESLSLTARRRIARIQTRGVAWKTPPLEDEKSTAREWRVSAEYGTE